MDSQVSAIVVCRNEERNIERCLKSLDWCSEVVIVDSFSNDRTVEICRRFSDRVIQRPWRGYRDQKAFAHSQATKEWVFLVDADEEVPSKLREEIQDSLERFRGRYAAFSLPRLVYYLGKWWRRGGWYPDYTIRLFRRELGAWGGVDPHEKILVRGRVRRLKNPLHHFSYRDTADHLERINHFTTVSAREVRRQGVKWTAMRNVGAPSIRFFRFYFWKRGFMEGFLGFFLAVTAAVYVFMKYAKLRELELAENGEIDVERD